MPSGALQFEQGRITTRRPILQSRAPHPILFDDFNGTLVTGLWTATNTTGGGAGSAAFAYSLAAGKPSAAHGGWLRGTVSDGATGVTEIAGIAVQWLCTRVAKGALIYETRFVPVTSVLAVNYSFGMSDLVTQGDNTMMNISGTTVLVTTAANGAAWIFDTRMTDPDKLVGVSVDANVDSAANSTAAVQGIALVADKSYVLRIEMDSSGNAFFFHSAADVEIAPGVAADGRAAAAGTTLKATLLTPYIGLDNAGAGANKSMDVDYIFVAAPRI